MSSKLVLLIVAVIVAHCHAAVTFQTVCSGGALPVNAVVAGDAQTIWAPSTNLQYLCIPEGTTQFGHMTNPSDPSVAYPGYCFYYNGSTTPNQLPPSTKCSQIAVSSTPVWWVAVSAGFPVQTNMITMGAQVAARTAPSSTNYGNTVPGSVTMANGVLGPLVADDFGYTFVDGYQVAMTSAPINGPLAVPSTAGSGLRIIVGVYTNEALDIVVAPMGSTNISFNLTNYQFGRASPWIRISTPQYAVKVYHSVQGKRGELLFSTFGLFRSPAATMVITGTYDGVTNASLGVLSVDGQNSQPAAQVGSIRLANMVFNSQPMGLLCNGAPLVAANVTYPSLSASYQLCGVAPVLSVVAGGAILLNLTSVPPTFVMSTVYVLGNMNESYPPIQAFLLLDRPLV